MTKEYLCNLCGESMCPNEKKLSGTWSSDSPHGLVEAKVVGGYESYHLFDMSQYCFNLCEPCLRKLFVQCKIKPRINHMNFPMILDDNAKFEEAEEIAWQTDQSHYEYRVWKDDGKYHQAYVNKKCNMVKDCPNRAKYTELVSDEFTEGAACEEHKDNNSGCINCKMVPFIPNVLKPFL